MTVNYFIECPICGKVTRMRSPAGYTYSTPVQIYCGSCNTKLTGEFIADSNKCIAYYNPKNCKEVKWTDYDYYGEASGELLANKIEYLPSKEGDYLPPNLSPALQIFQNMEIDTVNDFINFVCHMYELKSKWDKERIIIDLYLRRNYEQINKSFSSIAQKNGYDLNSEYNIHRYIYFTYFYNFGYIFKQREFYELLFEINNKISHIKQSILKAFVDNMESRLYQLQGKLFDLVNHYIKISQYLMPALGATFYSHPEWINKETQGITTCDFEDIKSFYQDTFEILAEYSDIIIALDNIVYRGHYECFAEKNLSLEKFRGQAKGNRIKKLNKEEFFSSKFNLNTTSNELRNAIGHNDYSYNGIEQKITYYKKHGDPTSLSNIYLLDIAIECVYLMRSSFILNIIVYELIRTRYRKENNPLPIHPLFYTKTGSNNHCRCGSGIKYSKCCKQIIEIDKRKKARFKLPQKANTGF